MKTHGLSGHPLYSVWGGMKDRCYNKNPSDKYARWGGRGIRVCGEWKDDAASFIAWAEANGWEKGLQLDRIDNDGNYSPDNCRFVTPKVNTSNRRDNNIVLCGGEWVTLTEACRRTGTNHQTLRNRIYRSRVPRDSSWLYVEYLPKGWQSMVAPDHKRIMVASDLGLPEE